MENLFSDPWADVFSFVLACVGCYFAVSYILKHDEEEF